MDNYNAYLKNLELSYKVEDQKTLDRNKDFFFTCLKILDLDDNIIFRKGFKVLDVGCHTGQFPQWLRDEGVKATGLEAVEPLAVFGQKKGRPVLNENLLDFSTRYKYDIVFSLHTLGLLPVKEAVEKMVYLTRKGGYVFIGLNIPGDEEKHYTYFENEKKLLDILNEIDLNILHFSKDDSSRLHYVILQK